MKGKMHKLGARDIRQVVAVAECGSIRRAAELLGMTQPGLSKNIRLVEERLGVPLFHRSTAGAQLTPAGLELLSRGKQLLQEFDLLERDLVQLGRGNEGSVAIGLGPLIAMIIGPLLVSEVERQYPAITLSIDVLHGPFFVPLVDNGALDFLCGHIEDVALPPSLQARQIYQHKFAYFTRSGHPLALMPEVRLADLCGYQFAATAQYSRFLDWFVEKTGAKAEDFLLHCPDHELVADIVARTDFVSGCSPAAFARLSERRALAEINVIDGDFDHYVHCVIPRNRPLSPAARHVLTVVEMLLDGPAREIDAAFCAPGFTRDGFGDSATL